MKGKRKLKLWHIILVLFGAALIITAIDFARISNYDVHPGRPSEKIHVDPDQVYRELKDGKQDIDWSRLDGTLKYISGEYDCSDFRYVNLLRILYEFEEQIPEEYLQKIKKTLFNFRYWWDDLGENSMCYWSENHQILFASAEYLVGQKYQEVVFEKSGLSGKEHMNKAREENEGAVVGRGCYFVVLTEFK